MASKGVRTSLLGTFQAGSPGFPGVLNCKAEIWHNSPFFKRKLQDETYVFAPETISTLPRNFSEKIEAIPGHDGLYLLPKFEYQHNFVASLKKAESNDEQEKNIARDEEKASKVVNISRLEFVEPQDESLVESILFKDPETGQYRATARASHHMWIDDGSLYVTATIKQSDFDSPPAGETDEEQSKEDFKRAFYPRWGYYEYNAPPVGVKGDGQVRTRQNDNFKLLPYQFATSPGDPIVVLRNKNLENDPEFSVANDDAFKNVNPGIHWRLIKRTPTFQGEDMWFEFHKMAEESDISVTEGTQFRMRPDYQFLDVNHVPNADDDGEVCNIGLVEVGDDQEKIEESKKAFDFSDQAYYIIELGVKDAMHNYFIILSERNNPIFCHAGKVWIREPNQQEEQEQGGADDNPSGNEQGEVDCNADAATGGGDSSGGSSSQPKFSECITLRRLSTYTLVSSKQLMDQERLRVTVRQHLGKIIVMFSGYEDNPWVISRFDLTEVPEPGEDPEGDAEPRPEQIPMIIPASQIAVMGGNRKVAMNFAPMQFNELNSAALPQRLSVEGPVDMEEIFLLLRDKGVSRHPSLADVNRGAFFTQEAELYSEWIDDKAEETRAIRVMGNYVRSYGKAPDMQERGRTSTRDPFSIAIKAKDCSKRLGSSAPYAKVIEVSLSMLAGDYIFTTPPGDAGQEPDGSSSQGVDWTLKDCITPIMTNFRLFTAPSEPAFDSNPIEVGHHVMSFRDSWVENDLLNISHGGQITFLVNDGMDDNFTDGRPNQANYLRSLADKNFYIQVSVWWGENVGNDPGATRSGEVGSVPNRFTDTEGRPIMPTPVAERDRVLFTGICTNAVLTIENGKHVMTCDLVDYSKALEDQIFLNSPFFDKMRDFNAINEIVQISGLRDGVERDAKDNPGSLSGQIDSIDNSQPASLIARLAASDKSGWFQIPHNGETIYNQEYALPGSYNLLYEPLFRFKDGESLWSGIRKIAQISGKIIYFDRLGVFHYEKLPYDQELFGGQQDNSSDTNIRRWEQFSKIDFFASPIDDTATGEIHRQIFGSYTISRDMDSVVNQIRVISNTPDGTLLLAGHTNFDSLFDIEKPGFLGYPKTLLLMDGIYGDEQNVKWIVKHYTKLFLPPMKITFKANGHNLIKALDIVTFRGIGWREKQVLIVGQVENEINPADNTWWQNFDCYWIFPSQNIDWGAPNDISIGPDELGDGSGL
tara:strand:+ start:311794 stop:315429 length:3636 start_codon:yes stop_codon:yes gene_type:complete